MDDILNQEKGFVGDFSLIYMLSMLILAYSIASVDYLTHFRRFSMILSDFGSIQNKKTTSYQQDVT